ncbi:MAG: hypothetical protein ACE5GJ_07920 [Gemmatimonadota bacterium]
MRTHTVLASALLGIAAGLAPLAAQDVAPPGIAEVEAARSAQCVTDLARLADLNDRLRPLTERAGRIQALAQAIALEDSTEVVPWDTTRTVDVVVRDWFHEDGALALRFVETRDSAVIQERNRRRETVKDTLRKTLEAIGAQGRAAVEAAGDVDAMARACEGMILVRTAVEAACASLEANPVCAAAADTANPPARYRFVESAEDLWDVEELRPWTTPGPLAVAPDGQLGGARTSALTRRGNLILTVTFLPMLQSRAEMDPEQAAEFDANLDSLRIEFDHPDFVMAPALEVQFNAFGILGGETHYVLHFGDLSDPASDVIWTVPAGEGGLIQARFPASGPQLARLQAGDVVSLTAVKMPGEEGAAGEPVYTLSLTPVGQAQAVRGLLQYMISGQLSRDLADIIPPRG